MAVRHGYGKIAGTDALVFAYDTGDTINSYKGEPTVNLIGNFVNTYNEDYWVRATNYYQLEVTAYIVQDENAPGGAYTYVTGNTSDTNAQLFWSARNTICNEFGQQVSVSAWLRGSGQVRLIAYDDTTGYKSGPVITLTDQWTYHKFSTTFGSGGTQANHWVGVREITTGEYVHVAQMQWERKPHATQYAKGTRSVTQGLLDLTGKSTIDLTNVSFGSNAQPAWDGTGDYIRGSIDPTLLQGAYTIEAVFKHIGTSQWEAIWSNNATSTNWSNSVTLAPILTFDGNSYPSTQYRIGHNAVGVSGTGVFLDLTSAHMNRYVHVCLTRSGTTIKIYANWEGTSLSTTGEYTAYAINPKDNYIIGRHWYNSGGANQTFNGEIPVVKIYNRALTPAEVLVNYNHYKTRFNL